MQNLKKVLPLLWVGCLTVFLGCQNHVIFEDSHTIQNQTWTYANRIAFPFEITDTLKVYSLFLDITHDANFRFQNLYTNIYTSFPSGEQLKELASLELTTKGTIWLGDCNNKYCKLSIPIQDAAYFSEVGKYTVTLEQYMRQDSLKGVHEFSFRIVDTGNTRTLQ